MFACYFYYSRICEFIFDSKYIEIYFRNLLQCQLARQCPQQGCLYAFGDYFSKSRKLIFLFFQNPVNTVQIIDLKKIQIIKFMKNLLLFVVIGLICLANCKDLWLDTQSAQYLRRDDNWGSFKVPARGGSGIYDYRYYDLPARWDDLNEDVLVPTGVRSGRYQFKIYAYDIIYKVAITKYVIFELTESDFDHYWVFLKDSYDSSYNIGNTYRVTDRETYTYPSYTKINDLIQQGDIQELEGIIMKVIDSDNDCDDKRQFLAGVISRIQLFLGSIDKSITTLERLNEQLESKLISLQAKIVVLESSIDRNISELKTDLINTEAKLDWYRKQLQQDKDDIAEYISQKEQLKKKIWQIKDVDIPALEKEIWNLKETRGSVQVSVKYNYGYYSRWYYTSDQNKYNDQISRKEKQLEQLKNEISLLEYKLPRIDKKVAELTLRIGETQKYIKAYEGRRADLKKRISQAKYDGEVLAQIESLKRQVSSVKSQIGKNNWEIKITQSAKARLQNSLEGIRSDADKVYYTCENIVVETVAVIERTTYFTFAAPVFQTYVNKNYNYDLYASTNLRSSYRSGTVNVIRCNPYAHYWTNAYGAAYSSINYRYGNKFFTNDFTCERGPQSYWGSISKIVGDSIHVSGNEGVVIIRVGSCSSLETTTGNRVPKIGDRLLWSGRRNSYDNEYRLHSGICF